MNFFYHSRDNARYCSANWRSRNEYFVSSRGEILWHFHWRVLWTSYGVPHRDEGEASDFIKSFVFWIELQFDCCLKRKIAFSDRKKYIKGNEEGECVWKWDPRHRKLCCQCQWTSKLHSKMQCKYCCYIQMSLRSCGMNMYTLFATLVIALFDLAPRGHLKCFFDSGNPFVAHYWRIAFQVLACVPEKTGETFKKMIVQEFSLWFYFTAGMVF